MRGLASLALMLAIVVLFSLWGVAMSHFLLEEPGNDVGEPDTSPKTPSGKPGAPSRPAGPSLHTAPAPGTDGLVVVDARALNSTIEALELEIEILKSQHRQHTAMGEGSPSPGSKLAARSKEVGEKLREKLENAKERISDLKEELKECKDEAKHSNKQSAAPHRNADHEEEPTPRPKHRRAKDDDEENAEVQTHADPTGKLGVDLAKAGKHPKGTIPTIVFAYKREKMLHKSMERILIHMPRAFHVYISQDGTEFPLLTAAATKYAKNYPTQVSRLVHVRDTSGAKPEEVLNHWEAYFAISHHYYFALSEVFKVPQYQRVVILEEDIKVAPDFFTLLHASAPLFDDDADLYCVSGWNDNGKRTLVKDEAQLYRSDFFPGLGWMTSRKIWEELKPIWPKGFWDDWMRQPDKRNGRSCLRPEVSRTFTWCSEDGTSGGQFCDHMEEMMLANKGYSWSYEKNITKYRKGEYDTWFTKMLDKATEVPSSAQVVASTPGDGDLKIYYNNPAEFQRLARAFDLMDDFKDKVPRTAYQGVVTFRYRKHRVHLVAKREMYT